MLLNFLSETFETTTLKKGEISLKIASMLLKEEKIRYKMVYYTTLSNLFKLSQSSEIMLQS